MVVALHLPICGVVLLLLLVVPLLPRRILVILQVYRDAVVVAQNLAVIWRWKIKTGDDGVTL